MFSSIVARPKISIKIIHRSYTKFVFLFHNMTHVTNRFYNRIIYYLEFEFHFKKYIFKMQLLILCGKLAVQNLNYTLKMHILGLSISDAGP